MYTEDRSKFFSVISLPISTRSLDLIAKTLEQDFNLRPSAQEILDSDAFEGVDEMKAQKELESILSVYLRINCDLSKILFFISVNIVKCYIKYYIINININFI